MDVKGSPPIKPTKFSVYQNPALSAAMTANSLHPSKYTFFCVFSFFSASTFALLTIILREKGFIDILRLKRVSQLTAFWLAKAMQIFAGLVFVGTLSALLRVISLCKARKTAGAPVSNPSNRKKDQTSLTKHQLGLLGIKPRIEQVSSESAKKPPKSKTHVMSPSDLLVPLHEPLPCTNRSLHINADDSSSSSGRKVRSISTPSKSPGSSSALYLVPGMVSPLPSVPTSAGKDSVISTPWSNKGASSSGKITSEEKLEKFLAEVDEKIVESAGKLSTPPPSLGGFSIGSPNAVASSANTSGPTRHTPLRPVRMSPSSQKFTPPKKGENDLPPPMSIEEAIEAFEHLGIYPEIEQWRDSLRQWFSSVLLNPLLNKIETSHIQVMNAAAKLGVSVAINQVGSDKASSAATSAMSAIDKTNDCQPAFTLNEDGLLHQLRASLVQAIEASTAKLPLANLQQSPQQNPMVPIMQECVDAITEHQRLQALMKGEWVKGLLPQSSIRADYIVQRIRELAEGTCLKNYEYLGNGEVFDKKNKKWTPELPSDTHLLLYLFCAFLEHPKWMLHVDPISYAGAQSSKNPLFFGVLPPKESLPEKYIAVTSTLPSSLHPGACILVVGKKSPPIFALYWDKKLQFSLQGRTALWDSILLLCKCIKTRHGGIVRRMHLGSPALSILHVLESESED